MPSFSSFLLVCIEIVVAMLSETQESKTDIEDNDVRERIQARILEYILRTQFED